jgi:hypothetical protein
VIPLIEESDPPIVAEVAGLRRSSNFLAELQSLLKQLSNIPPFGSMELTFKSADDDENSAVSQRS